MRWTGFKTLIIRECGVMVQFWSITLAPPILSTILYFIIFGEIIGARIGTVGGVDYARYMAPGLILLWAIAYSFGHTAAGFLGSRIFRYIEELLVSPLPGWLIITGYVASGMIRGLVVAICVGLTVRFFTDFGIHSIALSLVTLLLATLISAAAGFITANLAKTFDQVTTVQILILTPLVYLGGAFAPVAEFPAWARALSLVNPMFYLMNAFRSGVLGAAEVSAGVSLIVVATLAAILIFTALRMGRTGALREWPGTPEDRAR